MGSIPLRMDVRRQSESLGEGMSEDSVGQRGRVLGVATLLAKVSCCQVKN